MTARISVCSPIEFGGFGASLDKTSFASGRSIPITFQLTDASGNLIDDLRAIASLQIDSVNADGSSDGTAPVIPGNPVRYASEDNQFVAKWDTKSLSAGWYKISLALEDGSIETKQLQLLGKGKDLHGMGFTTTRLAASVTSSTYGRPMYFTAAVSPTGPATETPVGTVQFVIDGNNFGTPVAVVGGTAVSASVSTLSAGAHSVKAVYTNTDGSFFNSTSPDLAVTVAKASLTAKANDMSRAHGAPNPVLTATISGFQNGETLASSGVIGAPELSTTATAASPPGAYPITAAVGSLAATNYTFNFVNGTLHVVVVPTVQFMVNDGAAQRSRIDSITVMFRDEVVLDDGAFRLTNASGVSIGLVVNPTVVAGRTVAVLTFAGGSLADGAYTLTVAAANVHDLSGRPLDQDYTHRFFRRFGDTDGNGVVDTVDLFVFYGAFGTRNGRSRLSLVSGLRQQPSNRLA